MSRRPCQSRVFVGNLPGDVRTKDIAHLFHRYGKVLYVDLKRKTGLQSAFAFVEFNDPRSAREAVEALDSHDYHGRRLRVEVPYALPPLGTQKVHGQNKDEPGAAAAGRGRPRSSRSEYRVIISGLPSSGSWQDLKDHMRDAGTICFAEIRKDRTGVVEFNNYNDMIYAVQKYNDTRFRSHQGEITYIRVASGYVDHNNDSDSSNSKSSSTSRRRKSRTYSPVHRRFRS